MIETEIIYPNNEKGVLLKPDDGYEYITNGEVFSDSVLLGASDSVDNWHDTSEKPPEDDLK